MTNPSGPTEAPDPPDPPDPPAIRSFRADDRAAVVDLWRRTDLVRPWNDPDRDIDRKLAMADGLLLVASSAAPFAPGGIVGTIMIGYDGHRGSINYLAVHPDHQGHGLGRRLVHEAERRLTELGCPKLNLMVRSSNPDMVAFYRGLGYEIDAVTALGKRLIPDS